MFWDLLTCAGCGRRSLSRELVGACVNRCKSHPCASRVGGVKGGSCCGGRAKEVSRVADPESFSQQLPLFGRMPKHGTTEEYRTRQGPTTTDQRLLWRLFIARLRLLKLGWLADKIR